MKRALVLSGGGSKGSYQIGFYKALCECGQGQFDIVTGTSIGALNACMIAMGMKIEALEATWLSLDDAHVFAVLPDLSDFTDNPATQANLARSFFKSYLSNKGADVTPYYDFVRGILDEDKLYASAMDFGLCTVKYPSLDPVFITKGEMHKAQVFDWLMATSACFPIFPMAEIDGQMYIDGGYFDNVPVNQAIEMGATDLVVCDFDRGLKHPSDQHAPHVLYHTPSVSLGQFMNFDPAHLKWQIEIGYLDGLKRLGKKGGLHYTFEELSDPVFEALYQTLRRQDAVYGLSHRGDEAPYISALDKLVKPETFSVEAAGFAVMDLLCDMTGCTDTTVYHVHDVLAQARDMLDGMALTSQTSLAELALNFPLWKETLNRKGIVAFFLRQFTHPDFPDTDLTSLERFFIEEYLMALLIHLYANKDAD